MASIDDIVRGLTKSQGYALRNGDTDNILSVATPMTRCKLQEKGIVVNRQYSVELTDLGKLVRARLLSSCGEGK